MSNFQYTVGLNNVGSYQVAGKPYLTGSTLTETAKEFTFSGISKKILIHNTGSADAFFYFVSAPTVKLKLPPDAKCSSIFVSGSTETGVQLIAEVTNIPTARMYSLSGLEGI